MEDGSSATVHSCSLKMYSETSTAVQLKHLSGVTVWAIPYPRDGGDCELASYSVPICIFTFIWGEREMEPCDFGWLKPSISIHSLSIP